MKQKYVEKVKNGKGFIAALDQSGGSTPRTLAAYGLPEEAFSSEEEMFDLVHDMRSRIITSPAFDAGSILGAILFEQTMDRKIDGLYTADYLADKKGIVPFLKVDKGLADEENGVQMMKPMPELDALLARANERNIYGTKMRSVIKTANKAGIEAVVDQQFEVGKQIIAAGLMPIIEPEVDIHSPEKVACEKILAEEIMKHLNDLGEGQEVMLKLSIPTEANLYKEIINHPMVVRVVALSGGYSTKEANQKLKQNDGLIASFSRALTQDLTINQTDAEFNATLEKAVASIYEASV